MTQLPTPSIESLAASLKNAPSGQRCWFWMCSSVEDDTPALALQPFSQGGPGDLFAAAGNIPVPLGMLPVTGIAEVDSDGIFNLAALNVEEADLVRLSKWTKRHIAQHPDLARLRNIRLIQLSDDKEIIARFQDSSLWQDIPYPMIAGTPIHELRVLSKMKPGRSAWYWMTDKGPNGYPYFVAKPDKVDPKKFAALVTSIRKRINEPGESITGIVRINAEGKFIFTSQTDATVGEKILRLLQRFYDAASVLEGAYCLQMKDGKIIKKAQLEAAEPKKGPDLSRQSDILGAMSAQSEIWFWFTSSDKEQNPMLVVDTDRGALKAAAKGAGNTGNAVRGQVRLSSKGWVEFRIKDAYPNFIAPLAAFVKANHQNWPALRRLKGARMTQRQGDTTVDRQKNDAAWEGIPDPKVL